MPSAYTQNYYHTVFSTKDREALITPEAEERLYPFIGGILVDLGGTPIAINGIANHVHILTRYPSDLSHSDMLRHIKSRSSKWISDVGLIPRWQGWQAGYGGFTVGRSMLDQVAKYVRNQKEHHRELSFEDEFIDMLRRADIEFDVNEIFK